MKTIILPTDFSDNARNACIYAMNMFGFEGIQYILLHTYIESSGETIMRSIREILAERANSDLQEELETLRSLISLENYQIKLHSEFGQLVEVMPKLHAHYNIELIIMGTKGATGLKKIFLGSNAAKLIAKSNLPILTIPENAKFNGLKHVCFASDFETITREMLVNTLKDFYKRFQSEISVVSIKPKSDAYDGEKAVVANNLKEKLGPAANSFVNIYNEDAQEGLIAFLKNKKIELLVMVKREYDFLEGLFHKSFTEEFAMLATVPLFILHED